MLTFALPHTHQTHPGSHPQACTGADDPAPWWGGLFARVTHTSPGTCILPREHKPHVQADRPLPVTPFFSSEPTQQPQGTAWFSGWQSQARVRGRVQTQSRWPGSCAQPGPASSITHLDRPEARAACRLRARWPAQGDLLLGNRATEALLCRRLTPGRSLSRAVTSPTVARRQMVQ